MTPTIDLPESLPATLRRSSAELEKEIRVAVAVDWYARRKISQGRAAEIAGLSRAEFIDALCARKVEVFQVDLNELREELKRG